jgi:beta-glucosidase
MVGQVPVYYAHKNTGKPPTPETYVAIDDIPVRLPQTSSGFVSNHLDAGYEPQYPFGYGLSYAAFAYSGIEVSRAQVPMGETLSVSATVRNVGGLEAEEVVQLYVRDLVGNVTRPVRELKGFQRVRLRPGESRKIVFVLGPADLAFYGQDMRLITEPGAFQVWIGGSSKAELLAEFTIIDH